MAESKLCQYEKAAMRKLIIALDNILEEHIANRGTKDAFVSFGSYAYLPPEIVAGEAAIEYALRFYGDELGLPKRKLEVNVIITDDRKEQSYFVEYSNNKEKWYKYGASTKPVHFSSVEDAEHMYHYMRNTYYGLMSYVRIVDGDGKVIMESEVLKREGFY